MGDVQMGSQGASKKQESVVSEFNALLSSQMTAQRRYYEERQRGQELEHRKNLKELEGQRQVAIAETEFIRQRLREIEEVNEALEKEVAEVQASEELMQRQRQQLEVLNQKISGEQRKFE